MAPIAAGVAAGIGAGASVLGGILSPIIQGEYNKDQAGLDREHQAGENQKNRAYNSYQAILDREFQEKENQKNREFNSYEALLDREFQEHMRNTSFVSAVEQAKQLGISPSLLLGDQSNQLGGSKASASGSGGSRASVSGSGGSRASLSGINNPLSPIAETISKMLDQQHQRELAEDRQAHARELAEDRQKYQEERDRKYFEHQKEIAKIYSSNSATSKQANKRNYTKKELDNLFTPIDQVEI